jgi:hypothetical protein
MGRVHRIEHRLHKRLNPQKPQDFWGFFVLRWFQTDLDGLESGVSGCQVFPKGNYGREV